MPNSLLEYVAEGSMPVTASILGARTREITCKSADFPCAEQGTFATFGVFRNSTAGRDQYPDLPQTSLSEPENQRLGISALNVWRGFGP